MSAPIDINEVRLPSRRRLTPRELGLVKFIARHQAAGLRFVALGRPLRKLAIPLWRAGLLEIWQRRSPDMSSLSPAQFGLSYSGKRLAAALEKSRASTPNQPKD